jgi:hypothetical protein
MAAIGTLDLRAVASPGHDSIKTTEVYLKYLTPEEQLRAKGLTLGTNSGTEIPATDQANI